MTESKVLERHSVAANRSCLAGGEVVELEVAAQENKDQTLIWL
jgi:hypothetical protein